MTEDPVTGTLLRLTGPMVLGLMGVHAFNLVDTFFVGRLGTRELAAMTFTFPVVFVIAGVSLGLGLGTSAVVSRAIGRGDRERVRRLTTDSLWLATVVGRSITFTVALYVLGRRERMLTSKFPGAAELWRSWKSVLHIGVPGALTNILVPVGVGAVTRVVSGYGEAAVAAFGVASRIEVFALTPVMALRSVLAPFVGQNWGARLHDRLERGVAVSSRLAIAWGAFACLLLSLTARRVAGFFNASPDVVSVVALYIWVVSASYGLRGVLWLSSGALSVLRRPVDAGALMLLQVFALYVPLAIAGSHVMGLPGVFAAGLASNFAAGAAGYF